MRIVRLFLLAPLLVVAASAAKPNILFIFLDDFGWKDTGYAGSDFYETPHLDRLAREGLVFTDAYSCAANCAPARACLLSGQYTPRHEVYNVGTAARGKAGHRRLLHIPGTSTLPAEIVTWAELLRGAGYRTGTFGKWHASPDPIPYGFDVNVGGTHSGGPPKGYYPPHGDVPGLGDAPAGEWVTDTLANKAMAFMEEHRAGPWCVYFTAFAVHTPIQAKKDLAAKYRAKKSGKLHKDVSMATMIQSVDDAVGRMVAKLDEIGVRENTMILFFSDNGGYGPATDMDPLWGYKGTYYEGGIRVPFFANWPGRIAPGETAEPMIGVDIFPTFAELAGAGLPEQPVDGTSLVPLLTGEVESLGERALFWHFPAYLQSYGGRFNLEQADPLFRSRPVGVIRVGKYKLHQYFEDGRLELYDLEADIRERDNLAGSMPEKAAELLRKMEAWREATGAPVPSEKNPEFDAEAEAAAIAGAGAGGRKSGGKKRAG